MKWLSMAWSGAWSLLATVKLRDVCFWLGLKALALGLTLLHSFALASLVVGALLFLVAVLGVRPTKESPQNPPPR